VLVLNFHGESCRCFVEIGHCKLIDLSASKVRMGNRFQARARFQDRRPVEVLTDVPSDHVLNGKLPAWVVGFEFTDVKNQVLQEHELLAIANPFIEFLS